MVVFVCEGRGSKVVVHDGMSGCAHTYIQDNPHRQQARSRPHARPSLSCEQTRKGAGCEQLRPAPVVTGGRRHPQSHSDDAVHVLSPAQQLRVLSLLSLLSLPPPPEPKQLRALRLRRSRGYHQHCLLTEKTTTCCSDHACRPVRTPRSAPPRPELQLFQASVPTLRMSRHAVATFGSWHCPSCFIISRQVNQRY
jgi:hypothetical protein